MQQYEHMIYFIFIWYLSTNACYYLEHLIYQVERGNVSDTPTATKEQKDSKRLQFGIQQSKKIPLPDASFG